MTGPGILTVDRWCGGLDETAILAAFREDEARDRRGRWTSGGDGGGLDAKLDFDAINGAERSWGDPEDAAGAAIWKAAGYDSAQTRLVSPDEFGRLTGEGGDHIACYRGLHGADQAEADSYADAWKTGTAFCGQGMHGAGAYTSSDPAVGDDYAYGGNRGALLKIGLAPDAKVVTQKDIERQYETDKAAAAASGAPWSAAKAAVLEDPGHYASYLGYDAVSVPRADGSTWYLIQNRGATVTVR